MQLRILTISICWILCATYVKAQDTAVYLVKTNLFTLGEMQAIATFDYDNHAKTYILHSTFELWSVYTIDYYLEANFLNEELTSSVAKITANKKIKHYCSVKKVNDLYIRKTTEKTDTLAIKSITNALTKLYFETYNGPDSLFAEFSGSFDSFKKLSATEYELDEEHPQIFSFNKQRVAKITVPNTVLDFFIELKSNR